MRELRYPLHVAIVCATLLDPLPTDVALHVNLSDKIFGTTAAGIANPSPHAGVVTRGRWQRKAALPTAGSKSGWLKISSVNRLCLLSRVKD